MPPTRTRRLAGTCSGCGQEIPVGGLFTWGKRGSDGQARIFHPGCASGAASLPAAASAATGTDNATAQEANLPPSMGGQSVPMGDSVGNLIDAMIAAQAGGAAVAALEERIKGLEDRLAAKSGNVLSIELRREDGETVKIDGAHRLMPRLLRYIQARKHVFLWGGPGAGKTHAVFQAAKALGMESRLISFSPQSPRSDLMGLIDAMGTYRATQFRHCIEHGGVFFGDEGDNASAAIAVIMNTILANGIAAFPDGNVAVHPDFVCVIAGNTAGRGADPMFPERRLQDSAFLDRFRFIHWTVDEKLEEAVALAHNPRSGGWVQWVRSCRAFTERERIRGCYFTPRASLYGAQDLRDGESVADTAEAVCFRGVSEDVTRRVLAANPLPVYSASA